ncbi:MAG: hypothetical protein ACP5RW_09660 [bacterium]
MKRLMVFLEVVSLIILIIPSTFSQNRASTFMSFSPPKIEFVVDNISKFYTQQVDITGSIDIEDWELFCELDIVGIPKERILFAGGINPTDTFYTPFTSKIRLARRVKNASVFIPRLNIRYIPSWLDNPGTYQGNLIFSYRYISEGKEEIVKLASIPIIIVIKPIFSVTIISVPRNETRKPQNYMDITPSTLSFLVPYPGEWMSREILNLEVKTNKKNWTVQCSATELVEYEESQKHKNRVISPIPPDYLYVKVGDSVSYLQLSNSYRTIISGNNSGKFTIPLSFKLKTDESVLAGEYAGSIKFLFQGSE